MNPGVAIIGVGGLGCPAAFALARAGVPRLALFDGDVVEASNLPRQLLYRERDVGHPKATVAAARLRELAPACEIVPVAAYAGVGHAAELARWPIWIDGTDALPTKLWLSDLAVACGRTLVHGGAAGLSGQALLVVPGAGPCLRCLVEAAGQAESCRDRGVLGPVAGTIGALQARLALAALRGEGLPGTLIHYDAAAGLLRETRFPARPSCPACGRAGVASPTAARLIEPSPFPGETAG